MRSAFIACLVVVLAPLAGCLGGEDQHGPRPADDDGVHDGLDTWLEHREGPVSEGRLGGTTPGNGDRAQGSDTASDPATDPAPGGGNGSDGETGSLDPGPGDQGGDGGDDPDGGDGDDGEDDEPGLLDPINGTVSGLDGSGTGTGDGGDEEEGNGTLGILGNPLEGDDEEEHGTVDDVFLDALRG